MGDMDDDLRNLTEWVQGHVKKLVDDYWVAYYWRRDECKEKGIPMDWYAGCRIHYNRSGARIEWFYIQPRGKGNKSALI